MSKRIKSTTGLALIAAAIAALGIGGVALAQNASSTAPAQHAKGSVETRDEQGNAPDNSSSDSDQARSDGRDAETNDQPSAQEKEDPGTDQGEQ
jgi:hypothetical protein